MRGFTATFLVICFGILLPAASTPARICLLHPAERSEDCCEHRPSGNKDCCVETERFPDSLLPTGNFETPAFVGYEIPSIIPESHEVVLHIMPPPCFERLPTGIGPPTARLAVLNVWRL